MAAATLTISSRNYSSWSLRGWLLCRMAGLAFERAWCCRSTIRPPARSCCCCRRPSWCPASSMRVPGSGTRWRSPNTWPSSSRRPGCCPAERVARAHCRSISGEIHSGFCQPARGAADEPEGAPCRNSTSSPVRGPTSRGWRRSGANASKLMAAPSCSAQARRWPMRCMRRSARASSPTTSSSTPACAAYCAHHHGLAADGRVGGGRPGRAGRSGGTGRRVLSVTAKPPRSLKIR